MSSDFQHQQNLNNARSGKPVSFSYGQTAQQSFEISAAQTDYSIRAGRTTGYTNEYRAAERKFFRPINSIFIFSVFTLIFGCFTYNLHERKGEFIFLGICLLFFSLTVRAIYRMRKFYLLLKKVPYKYIWEVPEKKDTSYVISLDKGKYIKEKNETVFKVIIGADFKYTHHTTKNKKTGVDIVTKFTMVDKVSATISAPGKIQGELFLVLFGTKP